MAFDSLRIDNWRGVAAGIAAVALLSGCPKPYPNCGDDEDCKEHSEVCVQGTCRECATDAQCKEGFVCDANRCVPKPECSSDADCGAGKKCQSGRCVTHECEKDADCAPGSRCQSNRCVAAAGACSTDSDCPSGQECQAGTCVAAMACRYEPIYFDFNEHRLSGDAQAKLSSLADCVKKEKARVVIEGHADERGTEEYNLQLSNKRAASVKRYLTDLGVTGGLLETVGFGENRPAQQGSNESAWAANRRVEFAKH